MTRAKPVPICLALLVIWAASSGQVFAQSQHVTISGSGSAASMPFVNSPLISAGVIAFARCDFERTEQTITCSTRVYNIVNPIAVEFKVGGPFQGGISVERFAPSVPGQFSGSFSQTWTWTAADLGFGRTSGVRSFEGHLATFDDLMTACASGLCFIQWPTSRDTNGAVRVNLCPANADANLLNRLAICESGEVMPNVGQAPQVVVVSGTGSGAFETTLTHLFGLSSFGVAYAQCEFNRDARTVACSSRVYNTLDILGAALVVGGSASGPAGRPGVVLANVPVPVHISGAFAQTWTWQASDFILTPSAGITSFDDALQACVAGNCFLNWFDVQNKDGAIRAQLCPRRSDANVINGVTLCLSDQ